MKIFKSLAFLAGLAFLTTTFSAQDQNNPDPNEMAQKLTTEVRRVVTNITSDQETKITAVELDYSKNMNAARTNSNGDNEAMQAKLKPLRATRDAKIKTILTDDQYAKYSKAEAAHTNNAHVHKTTK